MQLFHEGLKDLLNINNYISDEDFGFLSIEVPLPNTFKQITTAIPVYTIGLNLRREYRHIAMGIKALNLKTDNILVFEAYNQHLLLLLPLLILTRKKIFIMLHGNQQFAMSSKIKYWGLLYLKLYLNIFKNLKVLLLEIDDDILESKFQLPEKSKIVIPHPLRNDVTPRLKPGERLKENQKLKIGIVGMIRADKPINKLIEKAQEYINSNPQVELIIGTPIAQKPEYLDESKINIADTTKEEDYLQTLQTIDILLIHYDQERYYYRTSGVISDAASCGCYIVASDYPVIKHQINYPVKIGSTFENFDELQTILEAAVSYVKNHGQDNHWLWREKRTAKHIAHLLSS
ncbi:MAG: glycosyltransferase family 1 protein [Xenococcaceae cyanobacterium MO_207.B15]|nr:glycosyltransferase family 1 protein [Xenococcaceae cyanobacterium MO_207.B15]